MNEKILVVDDDLDIVELLLYNLSKEKYHVLVAKNGKEAIDEAQKHKPDLILMDIMMPILNGLEAAKIIKNNEELAHIHLIMLTARSEEAAEVQAFKIGVDDFIAKPIKPQALISRIASIFSKKAKEKPSTLLQFEDLTIDKASFDVIFENNKLKLPKKEFELLYFLASQSQKIVDRDTLLSEIWGSQIVGARTVDVHIRKLREKLNNRFITTYKSVGYMFDPNHQWYTIQKYYPL